jgi:hypothetical protein
MCLAPCERSGTTELFGRCILRCMSATRTQIYLTQEQRKKLDARARREDTTLAQLIREAVDRYLENEVGEPDAVLTATFGILPELEVPSRVEWDRGYG